MLEKHGVCCALFHGFDWSKWTTGTPQERLGLLPPAQEHILAQENGRDRCLQAVRELSQAFALAVPHEETVRIRDDVGFFQQVRAALSKRAEAEARPEEDLDLAVRQIISRAVTSEGVIDIFAAAGLDKPDISVLSDEFLAEVQGMPQRNLAVELLQKLLRGELATRRRTNVVQARSFAEMLEQTLRRYQNRAIEAAQVIEELIELAREMREASSRGEKLGLTEDELAFYDALETNDSAVQVLGDETLRAIAQDLVQTVRSNVTIDWTLRENVRAQLRVLVRRILRRHEYPPDKQERRQLLCWNRRNCCQKGGRPPANGAPWRPECAGKCHGGGAGRIFGQGGHLSEPGSPPIRPSLGISGRVSLSTVGGQVSPKHTIRPQVLYCWPRTGERTPVHVPMWPCLRPVWTRGPTLRPSIPSRRGRGRLTNNVVRLQRAANPG